MGYESNYSLRVQAPTNKEAAQVLLNIQSESGETFEETGVDRNETGEGWGEHYEAHWYDWFKHIKKVAKKHPDVIIEVKRTGEDRDDEQIFRFKGQQTEESSMEKLVPPFNNILFKGEKGDQTAYYTQMLQAIKHQLADVIRHKAAVLGGRICFSHYHDEGITDRFLFYDSDDDTAYQLFLEQLETDDQGRLILNLSDPEHFTDFTKTLDEFTITEMMAILEEIDNVQMYLDETKEEIVTDPVE